MYCISMTRLPELFARLDEGQSLFLPAKKDGRTDFLRWEPEVEYAAGEVNAATSAKQFFFPQSERFAEFRTKGQTISITEVPAPVEPFVLFGVRACDVKAVEILDRVFLSEPADSFYQARRNSGTIISTACADFEDTCFCGTFGIDAAQPAGDISTWIVGDTLYWKPVTEKGKALTEKVSALLESAREADVEGAVESIRTAQKQAPLAGLSVDKLGGGLLDLFGSDVWDELSGTCLGCGSCTFICPTCQCYDVQDFNTGKSVQRFRCWDSCMYSDFTLMAHGNPRTGQKERFRQRFMHKLVYFPENNGGEYACVGCGRCISACPSSLNIVKVIKAFGVRQNV